MGKVVPCRLRARGAIIAMANTIARLPSRH